MCRSTKIPNILAVLALMTIVMTSAAAGPHKIHLGPRPFYLVEKMEEGELKSTLQQCAVGPFYKTDFSIGHRGAPLQFPEHTRESYEAAARMGAGVLECDVTFTSDGELVCRHAQCDLHTTTDIVAREDLREKCQVPPEFNRDGELTNAADITCCASDLTLDEFKSLCGKMDASNSAAYTVEEYLGGTANWRTDLYATCGTLLSHKESIELFKRLGTKMTPELKSAAAEDVENIFGSQEAYAQQMIEEYKAAGVSPWHVWAQSFNLEDVKYWIQNESAFGTQAVYLDGRYEGESPIDPNNPITFKPSMRKLFDDGVRIIAPPMWMLLTTDENGNIVPSKYAKKAKAAGLDIITWTLERSGRIVEDVLPTKGTQSPAFYHQSTLEALNNEGDKMVVLDVLAKEVGILGIFSDWPATVTYYANCMELR